MGRSVAVVCPKGGVGKTTVAVNLTASLADKGFKCLVVGIDPQCGVISSFGANRFDLDFGLLDFFDPDGHPDHSIQASGVKNLDFIPCNVWSREEEEQLSTWAAISPESLAAGLAPLKSRYDFIVMDCPPNLSHLTTSALMAADSILVPIQAEELAFQALPRLFEALDELRENGQASPELAGILLNQVDLRTRMAQSVADRVREGYPGKVYKTLVPRSVRLAEVAQRGKPVNAFNRAGAAAQAFAELADEFLASIVTKSRPDEKVAAHRIATPAAKSESAMAELLAKSSRRGPILTATGEILLGEDLDLDEDDGSFISLEDVDEESLEACRITHPDLDEYDGIEEGWH